MVLNFKPSSYLVVGVAGVSEIAGKNPSDPKNVTRSHQVTAVAGVSGIIVLYSHKLLQRPSVNQALITLLLFVLMIMMMIMMMMAMVMQLTEYFTSNLSCQDFQYINFNLETFLRQDQFRNPQPLDLQTLLSEIGWV